MKTLHTFDDNFDPLRYRGGSGRARSALAALVLFSLCGLCCAGLSCQARAGDPDTELRVRVAIAIAAAAAEPTAVASPAADCGGICRTDLDACRTESLRTGRPIVLFVGGPTCEGRAAALPANAIACRTLEYDGDGGRPTAKRVVILHRGTGRPEGGPDPARLYVRAALAGDAPAAAIVGELKSLDDPKAVSIDWSFGAALPAQTTPVKSDLAGECRTCVTPPAAPYARFLRR
ncbi:MAG: hypothetical protein KF873_01945 [Gemmataceae bacterium]|nr:hypothetical protein [Gemmataceae bacterium]